MKCQFKKIRNNFSRLYKLLFICLFPAFLAGCADPVANHEVKNFFFDGVPDLPSLDVLCAENMADIFDDYYIARLDEAESGEGIVTEDVKTQGSIHPPFDEKDCQGCHDFKKANKLITERKEDLCYVCHKNFIKGRYVHGPIAVSDCLACHVPHDSPYASLLQKDRNTICSKCHTERRLAKDMHDRVVRRQMLCVDCHDAHSGDVLYFLK